MAQPIKIIRNVAKFKKKSTRLFKNMCIDCQRISAAAFLNKEFEGSINLLCDDCKKKVQDFLKEWEEVFKQ